MIPLDPGVAYEVEGGLALVRIDVPGLPVFPAPTGGVAVWRGLGGGFGLGGRYTTWLGFDHRLGPEVEWSRRVGGWTVGARAHPALRIAGAVGDELALGGDLSTRAGVVGTWWAGELAVTGELGGTVQHVLFERLGGEGYTDPRPFYATTDLALELAWPDRWADQLAVRLEAGVPRAPQDPVAVLGVRPRLVLVGRVDRRRDTDRP